MTTFGPAYDRAIDAPRIPEQIRHVLDFLRERPGRWFTLFELERELRRLHPGAFFPQASVSANLRHLRKPQFGAHDVRKRRRANAGTWEYAIVAPKRETPKQTSLFEEAIR